MKYKDKLTQEMSWLAKKKETVFIGEGLINAGRVYGTLNDVPLKKCIEMPVAENLIAGAAIGLALKGIRPIIVFQRMDFMLIAADQIINHMALMPQMSGDQFTLPIIMRAIIGSQSKKFWVGEQHNHDFWGIFSLYVTTLTYGYYDHDVSYDYKEAWKLNEPVLMIEKKDLYEKEVT